jgi:regulator of RNase E activity RraA
MDADALDLDLIRRTVYAAVVSDCCDQVGARDRALRPGIALHLPGSGVLVGYARPVRATAVSDIPAVPYEAEVAFIDSLQPDDVVVAITDPACAFWGELFSTAAMARGAAGAVIDGYVRDSERIAAMGWPVFARGTLPTDSLGRLSITDTDTQMEVLGVLVQRGDIVVADRDGVVVVPAGIAADVMRRAVDKAGMESGAKDMLVAGAYLRDAWERYRVL